MTLPATPLLEHLLELRRRVLWALAFWLAFTVLAYGLSDAILAFLAAPLLKIFGAGRTLIYTGLTEAFMTYLRVALFAGFFMASPLILAQVWLFVAPGLFREEKRAFFPFLLLSPLLFLAGAALAYYFVCPTAWAFFLSFENPGGAVPLRLEARVSEYLSLMMKMILAFGVSFQFPLLLFLCGRVGLVTRERLAAQRKYIFLAIVIVAALITPPDLISPISLILPIYGLFELSLLAMHLFLKAP